MKYLISAFTGLGNFIQKTPLISAIHRYDDSACIDLIGDDRFGALECVKRSPLLREVKFVPLALSMKEKLKIISWLNPKKYDVIFLPFDSSPLWFIYAAYMSNAARVMQHIDIGNMSRLRILFLLLKPNKVDFVPILQGRHEIDLNYDFLETFLNQPIERDYTTWVTFNKKTNSLKQYGLRPQRYICIQPSAANGNPTPKTWATENFKALVTAVTQKFPEMKVVLVGDDGDSKHVIGKITWPASTINTSGKTNLADLSNLLRNASAVVVHDSGIMHMAVATGTPLVALYGPTDFTRTAPKRSNAEVLFSKTGAFAAMYNFKHSEKELAKKYPNYEAMAGISVDDVLSAVKEVAKNQDV